MNDLLSELAQQVRNKYYGKYRGFVADNNDKDKLGRLRLKIPSVLGAEISGWALPCMPFNGWFMVPEKDTPVWVEFEEGELRRPIWTGTYFRKADDVPAEGKQHDAPTTRLVRTPSGHVLELDDEKDKERIRLHHKAGAKVVLDEKGSISMTDKKGAKVVLDADKGQIQIEDTHGNKITMSSSGAVVEDKNSNRIELTATGIQVKGQQIVVQGSQVMLGGTGGEPLIKGSSFLTLFATHVHTHPGLAPGPTSPPIPQGEANTLSTKVMTQ